MLGGFFPSAFWKAKLRPYPPCSNVDTTLLSLRKSYRTWSNVIYILHKQSLPMKSVFRMMCITLWFEIAVESSPSVLPIKILDPKGNIICKRNGHSALKFLNSHPRSCVRFALLTTRYPTKVCVIIFHIKLSWFSNFQRRQMTRGYHSWDYWINSRWLPKIEVNKFRRRDSAARKHLTCKTIYIISWLVYTF